MADQDWRNSPYSLRPGRRRNEEGIADGIATNDRTPTSHLALPRARSSSGAIAHAPQDHLATRFIFEWEPSAELLGRGVEEPLIGDPRHLLFGRERPCDPAILLVWARDLRPLHPTLAGIGHGGPDDFVSLAWVADAAEVGGIARAHLAAGDVVRVTETIVPVGPDLIDIAGWHADRIGLFLAQSQAFTVEVDARRPQPVTDAPTGWDTGFLDLAGIAVEPDAWAGRDLLGEDLARWREYVITLDRQRS